MKIITKNAEALLFETAESLSNQPREGWQCIYFKIPEKWERQSSTQPLRFDIHNIAELLRASKGMIYQCAGGDTFILFRGKLKPVEMKLAKYLWCLDTGQITTTPDFNLFSIIDLVSHWQDFYKLCETRYLHALAVAETLSVDIAIAKNAANARAADAEARTLRARNN